METFLDTLNAMKAEIATVVKGKDHVIEKVIETILAKGHILIEDIPGVGKTTLALAVSKVMELDYNRVQFTPDVLPSDVIGFTLLSKNGEFEYKPGAILCNLFLADEINRTSSKTQSALLEVMEEGKVTVDSITRKLPQPFIVIATQNPVGSAGTQMLPESQLDRFMVKITMGYPDIVNEIQILKDRHTINPLDHIKKIVTKKEIVAMQEQVQNVFIHDQLYEYIANLVFATRLHNFISLGVSPRGTLAITNMCKASAFLKGRDYILPEDIVSVFPDVVSHRILLSSKARVNRVSVEDVISEILNTVHPPKL